MWDDKVVFEMGKPRLFPICPTAKENASDTEKCKYLFLLMYV